MAFNYKSLRPAILLALRGTLKIAMTFLYVFFDPRIGKKTSYTLGTSEKLAIKLR